MTTSWSTKAATSSRTSSTLASDPAASPAQGVTPRLSRLPETPSAGPESPPDAGALDDAGVPMDPAVIRQTYVRVDIPLSVLASRGYDDRPLTHFSIPVFDQRDLDVEITGHEGTDEASGSFIGRIAGKPGRIQALKRFLDYVQGFDDIWICRRIDIARHWRETHPFERGDAALAG